MRKRIVKIISVCLALLIIPVFLFICGIAMPPQFSKTYYAELIKMYDRLQETEGKRIVFVGCSGLAFGLRGDLVEEELSEYTVCPFGLYGAIGTKAMMDISRSNIKEGDIVVLAPEQNPQSLSLYFSGEHLWKSIDGNMEILRYVARENTADMIGAYPKYISDKYSAYLSGKELDPEGVYNVSSFNEDCIMTYDRPYNIMPDGYDSGDAISYEPSVIGVGFIDYINAYNEFVKSKGATLLYGFTAVNQRGVSKQMQPQTVDAFYEYLDEKLDCEILGDPQEYILDSGWFYDSNVHLNNAGSVVYTRQLVNDLKLYLADTSETFIEIPVMPEPPETDDVTGADGKDAAMFTYEEYGKGWRIVGLTEEGKKRTTLEIPDFYQGKRVRRVAPETFAGNTVIKTIYFGKYVQEIAEYSFNGCENLKSIYLSKEISPSDCRITRYSFEGITNFTIYVPETKIDTYLYDYYWRNIANRIEGY